MCAWTIDFSGVSDGGTIEPGKYVAKVKNITKEDGKSGYPYLKWELVIASGSAKGLHINHITTLKPEGLFNLRNTLIACGLNVPKSVVKLDPKKIIGKQLGIEVKLREYDGKEYPNVVKTMTVEEVKGTPEIEDAGVTDLDDADSVVITADDL